MFHRYPHESDIYPSLSRIPLHVRMKLDLTGIKISLKDWLAFGMEERAVLCHLPVESEEEKEVFSAYLDCLSRRYCGGPVATTAAVSSSLWDTAHPVPEPVAGKSAPDIPPVTVQEWRRWKSHHRYALYKTALSQSDPAQFFAVLQALRASED
ncbi:MAG TPA: nitrate reductase associated protein [Candidatus Binatia bacterium]|nr:nitrate reductase associated protein [Candidatus Binatia bacterium]